MSTHAIFHRGADVRGGGGGKCPAPYIESSIIRKQSDIRVNFTTYIINKNQRIAVVKKEICIL